MEDKKNSVIAGAKISGVSAVVIAMLTAVPEPYAEYIRYFLCVIASVGLICTQIPAPNPDNKKLVNLYKIVNFLGANWGQALNYVQVIKSHEQSIKK